MDRTQLLSVAGAALPVEQGGVDLMNARHASAGLNKEHRSSITSQR